MRDILNTYVKCHITPIFHNLYDTHKPLFGGICCPICRHTCRVYMYPTYRLNISAVQVEKDVTRSFFKNEFSPAFTSWGHTLSYVETS